MNWSVNRELIDLPKPVICKKCRVQLDRTAVLIRVAGLRGVPSKMIVRAWACEGACADTVVEEFELIAQFGGL